MLPLIMEKLSSHRRQPRRRAKAGFTLVEVMIALFIFGFMALSITMGALAMRKMAEHQVYAATALTVASGFMEQAKTITFAELQNAADGNTQILDFIIEDGQEFEVTVGTEATIAVPIDADAEGNTRLTMPMTILVECHPITDLDAVQIDLTYTWSSPQIGDQVLTDRLTSIRSETNTY
ncbi:MAG: type IV pilus modification PilV family protein [Verrucomicrobiota bacterium]